MDLWPEIEELKTVEGANKILEQQGEYLSKKTNNTLYLSIEEDGNEFDSLMYDFSYTVKLRSRYLEKYSFKLLVLKYNILMYPLFVDLGLSDDGLDEVIDGGYTFESKYIRINDEEDFNRFLKVLFNTQEVKKVLSSLLTLSK